MKLGELKSGYIKTIVDSIQYVNTVSFNSIDDIRRTEVITIMKEIVDKIPEAGNYLITGDRSEYFISEIETISSASGSDYIFVGGLDTDNYRTVGYYQFDTIMKVNVAIVLTFST
jgi:hypothetical protein